MTRHHLAASVVLVMVVLTLVLSGCMSQETKTVSARPDASPQTLSLIHI